MKKVIALLFALVAPLTLADTSDYIWNQQFDKKMVKAEAGDLKAQYDIGNMYLKGQGTVRNEQEAYKWFSTAAEKGYSRAQYKLGYLYHRGEKINRNKAKAFKWINKSARQGYKPAMYYLGKLYSLGDGVTADNRKALNWHKKAYAAGYNPAKREVDRLESKLAQKKPEPLFNPAPVQAARVAAPKPKARVRLPKAIGLSSTALKEILTKNTWQLKGKPALLLPSKLTNCKDKGGQLVCESQEMEYDEAYGVISYTMQTTYNVFSNKGEFTGEYNMNITLIFPNDPDDPDVVIPLEYGPQKKESINCKVAGSVVTCIRGAKKEKVTYRKI